ncbi:hypothetical protein ABFS82_11G119500 [Erythranthe guttata]
MENQVGGGGRDLGKLPVSSPSSPPFPIYGDIINMSDLLGDDTMGADIITAYDSTSHSSHKRVTDSGEPSSQPLPDFPLPLPQVGGGHSGGQLSVPLLTHPLAHHVQVYLDLSRWSLFWCLPRGCPCHRVFTRRGSTPRLCHCDLGQTRQPLFRGHTVSPIDNCRICRLHLMCYLFQTRGSSGCTTHRWHNGPPGSWVYDPQVEHPYPRGWVVRLPCWGIVGVVCSL